MAYARDFPTHTYASLGQTDRRIALAHSYNGGDIQHSNDNNKTISIARNKN